MYLNDIEGGMFQLPAFTEFYGTGLGIECIIIGCSTCLKLQHIILVGAGVYGYRMKRIFFFSFTRTSRSNSLDCVDPQRTILASNGK